MRSWDLFEARENNWNTVFDGIGNERLRRGKTPTDRRNLFQQKNAKLRLKFFSNGLGTAQTRLRRRNAGTEQVGTALSRNAETRALGSRPFWGAPDTWVKKKFRAKIREKIVAEETVVVRNFFLSLTIFCPLCCFRKEQERTLSVMKASKKRVWGHGGGPVVRVFAFYSDDKSSNHAGYLNFQNEKTKMNKTRGQSWPIFYNENERVKAL